MVAVIHIHPPFSNRGEGAWKLWRCDICINLCSTSKFLAEKGRKRVNLSRETKKKHKMRGQGNTLHLSYSCQGNPAHMLRSAAPTIVPLENKDRGSKMILQTVLVGMCATCCSSAYMQEQLTHAKLVAQLVLSTWLLIATHSSYYYYVT